MTPAQLGRFPYFVTIRRVGATVLVGAMGDIENVSQGFQPGDWMSRPKVAPCEIVPACCVEVTQTRRFDRVCRSTHP